MKQQFIILLYVANLFLVPIQGKQNLDWDMGINLELKEGPHSQSSYYPDFANYSFNFLPKASPGFSGSFIKWRPIWPDYSSKQIANIKTPFDIFEDIDVTMISGYDGDTNGTFEINKTPLISFQKKHGHSPGEFEMQALVCLKWFGFGHHDNCSDFVDIKFHMEHKSFFAATWIQPSIIFQTSFKGYENIEIKLVPDWFKKCLSGKYGDKIEINLCMDETNDFKKEINAFVKTPFQNFKKIIFKMTENGLNNSWQFVDRSIVVKVDQIKLKVQHYERFTNSTLKGTLKAYGKKILDFELPKMFPYPRISINTDFDGWENISGSIDEEGLKIGVNEDFEIQGNYFRFNSSVLAVMKVNESKALFEAYLADIQESTTATTTTTSTSITGCTGNQGWISDGYCDDINNNMDCSYDGGDCCGPNVNTQYCTVCLCINSNGGSTVPTTNFETVNSEFLRIVGDSTTTVLAEVRTQFFDFDPAILHSYNVWALLGALQGCKISPVGYSLLWIGDGFCKDHQNTPECLYDGGDCCNSEANFKYCSNCTCIETPFEN